MVKEDNKKAFKIKKANYNIQVPCMALRSNAGIPNYPKLYKQASTKRSIYAYSCSARDRHLFSKLISEDFI